MEPPFAIRPRARLHCAVELDEPYAAGTAAAWSRSSCPSRPASGLRGRRSGAGAARRRAPDRRRSASPRPRIRLDRFVVEWGGGRRRVCELFGEDCHRVGDLAFEVGRRVAAGPYSSQRCGMASSVSFSWKSTLAMCTPRSITQEAESADSEFLPDPRVGDPFAVRTWSSRPRRLSAISVGLWPCQRISWVARGP